MRSSNTQSSLGTGAATSGPAGYHFARSRQSQQQDNQQQMPTQEKDQPMQLQQRRQQQKQQLQQRNATTGHVTVGRTTAAPSTSVVNSAAANPHNSSFDPLSIDLGELTQTPRRRTSIVSGAAKPLYRTMRRILGLLTCFVAVSDLTLAIADICIGVNMMRLTEAPSWACADASAGRSVLASGVTGLLSCLSLVATQYLATGNTVVHSGIAGVLLAASLSHSFSALPRLQFSYEAADCTAKASAYLMVAGIARSVTLVATGVYYGLLNYYACKFGEDNITGAAAVSTSASYGSGGAGRHHR